MMSRRSLPYLGLLAIQLCGAMVFVWQELPEFRQVLISPGVQLPRDDYASLSMLGAFCVMQVAFWMRLNYFPVPFRYPNQFLNHALLFLARLSFIFAARCFLSLSFGISRN